MLPCCLFSLQDMRTLSNVKLGECLLFDECKLRANVFLWDMAKLRPETYENDAVNFIIAVPSTNPATQQNVDALVY